MRARKVYERAARRRSAVSRHFRRHRLYDRRIYTIVGLYTRAEKLLTHAAYARTYVRPAYEKKLDVTRAVYDVKWNEME